MLLEVFYMQNKDKLVAVLTRYSGDSDTSADAVQDAFLKALQNRDTHEDMQEKTLWSWLYTTAKNSLTDAKRKASRLSPLNGYDEAETQADLTDAIAIKDVLHELPDNLMHVVSLRYYGGMNATEIGELNGIPPATVRTQLRVALQVLRKHLAPL